MTTAWTSATYEAYHQICFVLGTREALQHRAGELCAEYARRFAPLRALHTPAEWRAMMSRYVSEKLVIDIQYSSRLYMEYCETKDIEWEKLAESFAQPHLLAQVDEPVPLPPADLRPDEEATNHDKPPRLTPVDARPDEEVNNHYKPLQLFPDDERPDEQVTNHDRR
jgi:hypothetical protein